MREILFRAKRLDNGEWIEGFYINIAKVNPYIATGKLEISGINKNAIVPEMYKVIPETVGQYTGLLDKNGKRIFEGDILAFNNDKLVCIYKNGCFGFMFKGCFVTFKHFCRTNFEVIGKIFTTTTNCWNRRADNGC